MPDGKPRAMVVYESMFGNTRQVAEAIGRGLSDAFDVRVVEVSDAPAAPDVGLLVVGGPVHAFGMSREGTREGARKQAADKHEEVVSKGRGVREWLATLAVSTGHVPAAAFDTRGYAWFFPVGSAAHGEARELRAHGYDVLARPEHFVVKAVDGPLADGELDHAVEWGRQLAGLALAPTR